MISSSNLIKCSENHVYHVERHNNSGIYMNDRSSTSNSNYYNQSLHLTENPSLSLIQESTKKEKRKKVSIRKT